MKYKIRETSAILSFTVFIGLNLTATFLPIQNWPLTNYPMFGVSKGPFRTFTTFYIEAIFSDKSERWKGRNYFNSANPREVNFLSACFRKDWEAVKNIVSFHAHRNYVNSAWPEKFLIIQSSIDVQNVEFIMHEEIVHEFEIER